MIPRLLCAALLVWSGLPGARADWFQDTRTLMGTSVRVELWSDNAVLARRAIAAALAEIARIDAVMSTYRDDSEVSRLNRSAARAPQPVGAELFRLLQLSLRLRLATDGAFDITYAGAGALFDYRTGRKPAPAELAQALPAIGAGRLRLDVDSGTVAYTHPRVRIDLGGIAKGYAVERAVQVLSGRGVRHAMVSAGGDSRFLGDRRGRNWRVAIRDPRDAARVAAVLPITDEAISTSGDYERFFIADGIRFHHILDPATGRSPDAVTSVSVIGPDATVTDALATGLFVLGVERGLRALVGFDGYDAVFVDADGHLHHSPDITQLSE